MCLENETTSLFNTDYVKELVSNFAEENRRQSDNSRKRIIIHLILYVVPKETLVCDEEDFIFVYDNFELSIGEIYTYNFGSSVQ